MTSGFIRRSLLHGLDSGFKGILWTTMSVLGQACLGKTRRRSRGTLSTVHECFLLLGGQRVPILTSLDSSPSLADLRFPVPLCWVWTPHLVSLMSRGCHLLTQVHVLASSPCWQWRVGGVVVESSSPMAGCSTFNHRARYSSSAVVVMLLGSLAGGGGLSFSSSSPSVLGSSSFFSKYLNRMGIERYRSKKTLTKFSRPSFRGTSVDEIPGLHARKISRIPVSSPRGTIKCGSRSGRSSSSHVSSSSVYLCHNPIFTPGNFLGCRHAKRGSPNQVGLIRRGLITSNTPKKKVRDTFPRVHRAQKPLKCSPGYISKSLESFDQVRPSLTKVDQAHLGGNVCAKILSDPLQLGPRAKTLRQEVHFSYHMQLSDRQEFLRSSRNLSQKMTPWHEEHSDGLRSQDHILRTQTRLCARPVPLKSRVFLTRNKLICEPGHIGKKTHSCTTRNSRIAKNLSGPAGIPIGKLPSNGPKTPRWPLFAGPYLTSPSSDFRKSGTLQNRQRKLSDGTKNVKIRHRELGQICARTGTRFEKKRAGSKTHFFSRTAAFARRVFPARNKLIREPGCVGKIMTPATTWNSRFADSIPRLTGIFIGKVHKNSSDTPTSGSHNSSRPNSDSCKLYIVGKRRRGFPTICA
uniref:Uncharacterized protein n=1 Tax=Fagus sylvatica TaxID=28930 RepID=A0A2N9FKK4_FAGSY